jgi:hypothetical protein
MHTELVKIVLLQAPDVALSLDALSLDTMLYALGVRSIAALTWSLAHSIVHSIISTERQGMPTRLKAPIRGTNQQ